MADPSRCYCRWLPLGHAAEDRVEAGIPGLPADAKTLVMPCALALRPRCRRVYAGCLFAKEGCLRTPRLTRPRRSLRRPFPRRRRFPLAPLAAAGIAARGGALGVGGAASAYSRAQHRFARDGNPVPAYTTYGPPIGPQMQMPIPPAALPGPGVPPQTLARQTAANRTAAPAPTPAAAPPAAPATPPAAAPAAVEGIRTASSDAIHGRDGDSTGFALRHIPTPALANDPVRLLATSRSA